MKRYSKIFIKKFKKYRKHRKNGASTASHSLHHHTLAVTAKSPSAHNGMLFSSDNQRIYPAPRQRPESPFQRIKYVHQVQTFLGTASRFSKHKFELKGSETQIATGNLLQKSWMLVNRAAPRRLTPGGLGPETKTANDVQSFSVSVERSSKKTCVPGWPSSRNNLA